MYTETLINTIIVLGGISMFFFLKKNSFRFLLDSFYSFFWKVPKLSSLHFNILSKHEL